MYNLLKKRNNAYTLEKNIFSVQNIDTYKKTSNTGILCAKKL